MILIIRDPASHEQISHWYPLDRQVGFESLINIRPRQQNFELEVQDHELRSRIEAIARRLLEVEW